MKRAKTNKHKFGYVRTVGEKYFDSDDFVCRNSDPAHKFARRRKKNPTAAERRFEQILNRLDGGFFAGKFEREWAICGKWILDFYFPEYRLAIEIDGGYHNSAEQMEKDSEKAADCEKLEITLLRFTNQEIFGEAVKLLEKFKHGLELATAKAENCTKINGGLQNQTAEKPDKTIIELTEREQDLIRRNFEFYKSLANGNRQPETDEQKHFVAVCRRQAVAETEHEIAFIKFIRIQSALLKEKR